VRSYVDAAGIGKKGSCHLFRHTMATLMLEGGADTRFIQQMLGHENLASAQLYTQVSIKKLMERKQQEHDKDQPEVDPADVLAALDEEEADEDG
jgi:integrase/recombinase XerD